MLGKLLTLLLLAAGCQGKYDVEECLNLGTPKSKCVCNGMLEIIEEHIVWDDWPAWEEAMDPFWTEDMIYDSNWTPNQDFGNSSSLKEWFDREHIPFNLAFDNCTFQKMIWIGTENTASSMGYGKATWIGDLGTVPGSEHVGMVADIWDLDFYLMDEVEGKIAYNWCLIDFVDLMRQIGYQVLPKPALREGFLLPPQAMDGIPAPISRIVDPEVTAKALDIISELFLWDMVDGDSPSALWQEDMVWYGVTGFGMATNKEEYETHILAPLRAGISDRSLDIDILHCEGSYCGAHGHLYGTHSGEWLGEPATGLPMKLRFAWHWRVDTEAGSVPECWGMFDLPAAFNEIGINLYDRMTEEYRIKN